jgi:ArsR family transcriptional regulator, arsenate/arsenite/antimonite-responsive transcriptional repressor
MHNRAVGYALPMGAASAVISERQRQVGGCSAPLVQPDLSVPDAARLALVAKALADPTRLRIVDALRKASPEAVCQCELLPLFDMSQPALAKHLKVLIAAGILRTERRGLWAFYFTDPDALEGLRSWLT